ncbi:protein kinase [Asanoa sp. WMMD1127]|uniref:serine/threonine-protein kinase n=1 Tax=Asanoa sp. WMMD1127 TaxID=3016107 RepID=UPI0024169904|nr:serine/threonine-protein kinase [Asanoa sp. WMMD1127]MDG4826869.1 protein kinase [Asanoa sp. WMMD1127]
MFHSGLLVNDRYRLDAPIAAGGMGEVWRASDAVLGRTVAVKVLHRLVDDNARARFRNEARAMAALHHPGVADVYDYGETDLPDGRRAAFIVMACVEGEPLSHRIADTGRLGAAETASIVAQTARALQAAHDAGVVHRDVKPGNLIVEPDGTVVLIDFGVAVTAEAAGQTRADEVVGTALYMAPEQVAKGELTPATDVYALGAVAYHCLAGRPPFEGDNAVTVALRHLNEEPAPLPDDVPAELREVVATAMAKDPALRYPTAAAVADAIEERQTRTAVLAAAPAAAVAAPLAAVAGPSPAVAAPSAAEAPPPRPRMWLRAAGALVLAAATLLTVLALADPTGVLPLPGGGDREPNPPAATSDAEPASVDTEPVGGEPRPTGPSAGAPTAGPTGQPGATNPPAGTDPGGGTGPDDSDDPAPTPTAEPTTDPEPTAEPTTQPDEPDEPEPTPSDDVEPASSPAAAQSS